MHCISHASNESVNLKAYTHIYFFSCFYSVQFDSCLHRRRVTAIKRCYDVHPEGMYWSKKKKHRKHGVKNCNNAF